MSNFTRDLIVGLICVIAGAGITWYLTKGEAEENRKMYEQARKLNEQTEEQNKKIVEQTDILSKGFSDLVTAVKADENINPNISVTVNNMVDNVNTIRNIALSQPIVPKPKDTTQMSRPREVKISVGSYVAVYIDTKNYVALKEDKTNGKKIYAMLNGRSRSFYVGDDYNFTSDRNEKCKITYMGIQDGFYIFSIACGIK